MQKVHIVGKLKTITKEYFKRKRKIVNYDKIGYLKDKKIFYPDQNNLRKFYKIVSCEKCWDKGIFYTKLEEVDEKNIEVEVEVEEEIEEVEEVEEEEEEVEEKKEIKNKLKERLKNNKNKKSKKK